jgi:hypothetical protein
MRWHKSTLGGYYDAPIWTDWLAWLTLAALASGIVGTVKTVHASSEHPGALAIDLAVAVTVQLFFFGVLPCSIRQAIRTRRDSGRGVLADDTWDDSDDDTGYDDTERDLGWDEMSWNESRNTLGATSDRRAEGPVSAGMGREVPRNVAALRWPAAVSSYGDLIEYPPRSTDRHRGVNCDECRASDRSARPARWALLGFNETGGGRSAFPVRVCDLHMESVWHSQGCPKLPVAVYGLRRWLSRRLPNVFVYAMVAVVIALVVSSAVADATTLGWLAAILIGTSVVVATMVLLARLMGRPDRR